jgi:hypothetical protein
MSGQNFYEKLPFELLAGFYYHIKKNIEKGILSKAMYYEIGLIESVAIRKGISLDFLYKEGSKIIKKERVRKSD